MCRPPSCTRQGPFYNACRDRILLFLALNNFCLVWVYLLTTTGPSVWHSPSPDKRKLFCLFVCRGTLSCYDLGAFSLPIPHGMHLVVPTQLCFFWVVYHPSMTLTFPYPWGSWVCHQPLTLFAFITLGLLRPILTFPNHIPPMVCFFSLSGLL